MPFSMYPIPADTVVSIRPPESTPENFRRLRTLEEGTQHRVMHLKQ